MEMDFQLDTRLSSDSFPIARLGSGSQLLLHKNASVVWFIIVPRTVHTELFELPHSEQLQLLEEINQLSAYIKGRFKVEKLNIATIGNIVSQMHIHVIGRSIDDPYWPGVVWGEIAEKSYSAAEVEAIALDVREKLTLTPPGSD